jgi:hypothetical protein
MKPHEEKLLNRIKQGTPDPSTEILGNVKQALGDVAYVKGNPLTKTEITLNVKLIFLQDGFLIQPAAIDPALQTTVPVFLLGLTDFYGGYLNEEKLIKPNSPWAMNPQGAGIYRYNAYFPPNIGILLANGLVAGDMLLEFYANALGGHNYNVYVLIHCSNVAYGTFLNSFVSDLITIDTIRYIVPIANVNQFMNPIIFGYQSLFGKLSTDNVDPRMYITSKDFQQQIADIPINLPIDKAVFTGFQMNYDCPQISWILFVKKVEKLTHKK